MPSSTAVRVLDSNGAPCGTFLMGDTLVVEVDLDFERAYNSVHLSLEVKRVETGQHVLQW